MNILPSNSLFQAGQVAELRRLIPQIMWSSRVMNALANIDENGDPIPIGVSGGAIWGAIAGTLSNQTDLQTILDTKLVANPPLVVTAEFTFAKATHANRRIDYNSASAGNLTFDGTAAYTTDDGNRLMQCGVGALTLVASGVTFSNPNGYALTTIGAGSYIDFEWDATIGQLVVTGFAGPINLATQVTGILSNTHIINGGGSPTVPTDFKDNVDCATTANITLSGEQTIDGVLTSASRVLVKNQTTASQNGIYVSAAGAWSRSTDADISAEVTSGMLMYCSAGTVNGDQIFVLTTPDPITLATTSLTFIATAYPVTAFVGKTVAGTTYTHVLTDSGKRLNLTNAAAKAVTIAPQSSVNSAVNTEIEVFNAGAGLGTLTPGAGVTLNSLSGVLTIPQYHGVKLKKRSNPNTWDVTGIPLSAAFATFLGTPSSANLAALVSDETGSGALVFATSPTLVTPVLGVATATSVNKVALTAPATGSTIAVADGKTFTVNKTLTLAGTDGTTMTFPAVSASVGYINIPTSAKSANYTVVAADAGTMLEHPASDANARTFTIDNVANQAWLAGSALSFKNETSQVLSIAVTNETLTLAGTTTTGTRSIAQNGIGTAHLNNARTGWIISGAGVT